MRHRLGRDLIRQGRKSVHLIRTDGGRVAFEAAHDWDVLEGWRYRLQIPQPTGKVRTMTVPRDGVAHFQWSTDPREPWRGLSPLEAAPALGKLAGRVESKLCRGSDDANRAPGPDPHRWRGRKALDSLRADIGGAKGAAILVESTTGGWDEGRQQAGTRHDWRAERLGPVIPEGLRSLWTDVQNAVASAAGIPASLAGRDADGTQLREDYRRFIMSSVEPVAAVIAEVASEALETEVKFDFRDLWGHDLAGRASAFQKLVAGGVPVEKAVAVVGLLVGE